MTSPRLAKDRIAAYRNRNAAYRLPETRDIDHAIVASVRASLDRRGIETLNDLDALPADDDLRLLVARVVRVLREARFAVGEHGDANSRVWRRLGLDGSHSNDPISSTESRIDFADSRRTKP